MWPLYYPKYLPFPHAIGRPRGPVPNQQSVDWPQAQFAPRFLPSGSPSFQPYVFNHGYKPLRRMRRLYMADRPALAPEGAYPILDPRPGDTASNPYEIAMARRNSSCSSCARSNPSEVNVGAAVLGVLAVGALYWYVTAKPSTINEDRLRKAHTLQGW